MYTAGEVDLPAAATALSSAIPTLQHVFLMTCGQTKKYVPRGFRWSIEVEILSGWLASKAWRVVRRHQHDHYTGPSHGDVGDSLTELSGGEAERIMDREELHLFRYEEVGTFGFSDWVPCRLTAMF